MRRAEFEPTVSASERPQTHALDRAAPGISHFNIGLRNWHSVARDRNEWRTVLEAEVHNGLQCLRRRRSTVGITDDKGSERTQTGIFSGMIFIANFLIIHYLFHIY
jgi:hypothetical protein